jgi:hypothetical protein
MNLIDEDVEVSEFLLHSLWFVTSDDLITTVFAVHHDGDDGYPEDDDESCDEPEDEVGHQGSWRSTVYTLTILNCTRRRLLYGLSGVMH